MKKRVIFLDIDGVLNNALTDEIVEATGFIGVDDRNLKYLIELKKQSKAKIVLSSTWQQDEEMLKYLKKKLWKYHIRLSGVTDEKGINRGEAIRDYITKHHVTNYVVIDDWQYHDFFVEGFIDHVLFTDMYKGLQESDIEKILGILKMTA